VISCAAAKPDRPRWRKVAEIMTQNVITVTADTPLDGIVQLMERRRIKRVPVMEGDALVGIVSRADPSDEEILEQIHAALAKVVWVPRDGLSIMVKDGVVDLDGVILEEREREALRVVAENVAGVKAVEDHLVWIEPVSGIVIDPRQDERGSS
jgi:predicted transcriptional regulator